MLSSVHLWRRLIPIKATRANERLNEGGRKTQQGTAIRALQTSDYLRRPSFPMICWYRVRSSRVRYFKRLFRLPTILSSPRREE